MQFTFDPERDSVESVLAAVGHLYHVRVSLVPDDVATPTVAARDARRRSGRRTPQARSSTKVATSAEVRAWAAKRRMKVSSRGRLPASVLEQYAAAHS